MMTYRDKDTPSFRIGDVVTLRTGGPRMTVTHVGPVVFDQGEWVICQWFDEHGEFRQEMFPNHAVVGEPRTVSAGLVRMRSLAARGPAQA
ncbi:YodC family protein [Burkholderia sp. TSV86]|uniref:YodC family protein n=1 Tax=Burkholderia sp. TSV86 TaxID=1385594 RepID=UPI0009EC175D|nr:YodC family protein [Burkholderia sp. TSV86]